MKTDLHALAHPARILVLNGPNLNMLGMREPALYGHSTLVGICTRLEEQAQRAGATLHCVQSNAEFTLIDAIHQAHNTVDFILFNPAAFTHTSIALRDALLAVAIPFVEIHLSNIFARESFRHHSFFSDIAVGVISGIGEQGYSLALDYALHHISQKV